MPKAQPVKIGDTYFSKKGDARLYLKEMLNRYKLNEKVSLTDSNFLKNALTNHPDYMEKIGVGIDYFIVQMSDYGTPCFWVVRIDGTEVQFSYQYCL